MKITLRLGFLRLCVKNHGKLSNQSGVPLHGEVEISGSKNAALPVMGRRCSPANVCHPACAGLSETGHGANP